MDKGELKVYCREHGHEWTIRSHIFWDTAICLTCGEKIRDLILRYRDLPNRRPDK